MASSSPARAAIPILVLALVLLGGVAGTFVAMDWNANEKEQAATLERETGLFLAAVESGAPSLEEMAERYFEASGSDSLLEATPSLYVVDRDGGAQLIYRPPADGIRDAAEEAIDWRMHQAASESDPVQTVRLNEQGFMVAMRSARNGRAHLALVAPAATASRGTMLGLAGALVLGGWAVLAALVWGTVSRSGRRPLARIGELARQLAADLDDEPDLDALAAMQTDAEREIGDVAEPLFLMANSLGVLRNQRDEARAHLNALFQVHSSYVLLVTLDGTIVDANPAFYAVSGLPHETVRGAPLSMLDEIMPLEPVLKLAKRSQSEGAAFADIDYAIKGRDDTTRPLKLSLLAVRADGRPAVLIVATDKMKERTLERQIESFADSLDLMVDKRMEELSSGQERVDALVAATGAVLMAFDRVGATRRWNKAAEQLTSLTLAEMAHVDALTQALGLDEEDRTLFSTWFFDDEATPCVVTVHAGTRDAALYAWRRAHLDMGEQSERRVLVGVALPPFADQSPASAAPSAPAHPLAALDDVEALTEELETAVDMQALARDRLQALVGELGAPLDSMRTYTLRLQSMPAEMPAEAQTCLQMIDGAAQLIETIVGRAADQVAEPVEDPGADPASSSGDALPDSFLSGDMLGPPLSTTPVENS
ncbi:MAG: PAS domain-containing protein [Bacteroidota bacterium]